MFSKPLPLIQWKRSAPGWRLGADLGAAFGWPYGTLCGAKRPCSLETWSPSPRWQLETLHHQSICRLLICHNHLLWQGNMLQKLGRQSLEFLRSGEKRFQDWGQEERRKEGEQLQGMCVNLCLRICGGPDLCLHNSFHHFHIRTITSAICFKVYQCMFFFFQYIYFLGKNNLRNIFFNSYFFTSQAQTLTYSNVLLMLPKVAYKGAKIKLSLLKSKYD